MLVVWLLRSEAALRAGVRTTLYLVNESSTLHILLSQMTVIMIVVWSVAGLKGHSTDHMQSSV